MKKKKQSKPIIFVQDYGTYSNELLVLVGVTDKRQIYKFLKKKRANMEFSKWVLEDFDHWKSKLVHEFFGLVCTKENMNGSVLVLRTFEDTWTYWENLIHETHHIVQDLAKKKMMFEEAEAQAYLQEYLFRNIRRKLQKIDPL